MQKDDENVYLLTSAAFLNSLFTDFANKKSFWCFSKQKSRLLLSNYERVTPWGLPYISIRAALDGWMQIVCLFARSSSGAMACVSGGHSTEAQNSCSDFSCLTQGDEELFHSTMDNLWCNTFLLSTIECLSSRAPKPEQHQASGVFNTYITWWCLLGSNSSLKKLFIYWFQRSNWEQRFDQLISWQG